MARKAEDKIKKIREKIVKWRTYFRRNIEHYHAMTEFVQGAQWTDNERETLTKTLGKTPMQFNMLGVLSRTLLGEQQQNTPQLEVVPTGNCDEGTARIREVVVKDLMLRDETKKVYQKSARQGVDGGFGAFYLYTEYAHTKSFDLDIVYHYLHDPTLAYWDVGAKEDNKIDGMHAGFCVRVSREQFRAEYGRKVEKDILNEGVGQKTENVIKTTVPGQNSEDFVWADDDGITVLHHFQRTMTSDTLYKLSNGQVVDQAELDEIIEQSKERVQKQQMQQLDELASMIQNEMTPQGGVDEFGVAQDMSQESMQDMLPVETENEYDMPEDEGMLTDESVDIDDDFLTLYVDKEAVRIEDKREIKRSKITHTKCAGYYVLDEAEFPSEDLPVIFLDHDSWYDKDGKQVCRSFVEDAKDAQIYRNYLGTQAAYILKNSRWDQWIGSKKNVASNDTQKIWKNPQNMQGMLVYDESPNGNKPEQIRAAELPASLISQYQRATDDIYTTTGLYPSRLGDQGNEVSGKAIDARTQQGSYATYLTFSAINNAIAAGGKILNQMIPRVYDAERIMTLMTPDKGRQTITVNTYDEYGAKIENDLRKGEFQVKLLPGPSWEGQKQQALDSLTMIVQANPSLFPMFADLIAENLPLPNTIEIKNRLKTLVPKEVLQAGESGEMPEKAHQPSAQDQAAAAAAEAKREEIQIKKQELAFKMQDEQSKNEIKKMEMEYQRLEAAEKLEVEKLKYLAETDRTQSDNAIAHADNITKILTSGLTKREV